MKAGEAPPGRYGAASRRRRSQPGAPLRLPPVRPGRGSARGGGRGRPAGRRGSPAILRAPLSAGCRATGRCCWRCCSTRRWGSACCWCGSSWGCTSSWSAARSRTAPRAGERAPAGRGAGRGRRGSPPPRCYYLGSLGCSARRFLVRALCSVLGLFVWQSRPRRARLPRALVANHVTPFDHNVLALLASCRAVSGPGWAVGRGPGWSAP